MSIGEIGGVIGPCEECRHTHGTSSCGTCGGGTGNIGPPTLAPCRACLDGIAASPAITAGGDDDELILVDDEPSQFAENWSPERLRAQWMFRMGFSGAEIAEANKISPPVDAVNERGHCDAASRLEQDPADAPTEVLNRADVVAALAPIDETWRKTWTECADLLKAVAEKDPQAAAGYVAKCRDWLTSVVQYGS